MSRYLMSEDAAEQYILDRDTCDADVVSDITRIMAKSPADDELTPEIAESLVTLLLSFERHIIAAENLQRYGYIDGPADDALLQRTKKRYQQLREMIMGRFGDPMVHLYCEMKDEHNCDAGKLLVESNGTESCCVLPEFYEDGSHDPFGEDDVPWNAHYVPHKKLAGDYYPPASSN